MRREAHGCVELVAWPLPFSSCAMYYLCGYFTVLCEIRENPCL